MSRLCGFVVCTDEHMTIQDGFKYIKIPWKERSIWNFWKSTKSIPNIVPRRDFIIMDKEMIMICHPVMKEALEEHLESLI